MIACLETIPPTPELRPPGAAAAFAVQLQDGLARRPELGERLAFAETSVCLRAGRSQAVTLLLDRLPPEVHVGAQPAEVEVELPRGALDKLAAGELLLPLALMAGEARHAGPVRRLLGVSPILRSLLAAGANPESRP